MWNKSHKIPLLSIRQLLYSNVSNMPGPPKTKEFQKREKENLQSVQLQVSIPQRIL
jgi:hypothetical protein